MTASQPYKIEFENFEIALVLLWRFQTFQKCTHFQKRNLSHRPPKHVITSNGIRTRKHLVC